MDPSRREKREKDGRKKALGTGMYAFDVARTYRDVQVASHTKLCIHTRGSWEERNGTLRRRGDGALHHPLIVRPACLLFEGAGRDPFLD